MHVHTPINNTTSSAYIPWVYDALLDQVCLNYTANHLVRKAIAPETAQRFSWGAFAASALTSGITSQTPAGLMQGGTNFFTNLYHGAVGSGLNRLFGVIDKEEQDWASVIGTAVGQSVGNIIASSLASDPTVKKTKQQASNTVDAIRDTLAMHPAASPAERKALIQEIVQEHQGTIGGDFDVAFNDNQFYFDYLPDDMAQMTVDFNHVSLDNIDSIRESALTYIDEYSGVGSGPIAQGMSSVFELATLNLSLSERYHRHHQARALQQAHNASSVNAFATQQYVHAQTSALYNLASNVTLGSVLLPVGGAAAGSLARSTFALGQGVWNGGRALVTGIGNTASFTANSMRMGLGSFGQSLGAGITANLPAWSIAGNIGVSGLELATGTEFLPSVNDAWKPGVKLARSTIFGSARETGDLVTGLLYGAKAGAGLPGSLGLPIAARPTALQLENLTLKHNVEFAVTYKLGKGKNGKGGQYFLHSGGNRDVRFPLESDRIFIYHTHPGGTPFASPADREILEILEMMGSPQRSSQIIPVGTDIVRFNKFTTL